MTRNTPQAPNSPKIQVLDDNATLKMSDLFETPQEVKAFKRNIKQYKKRKIEDLINSRDTAEKQFGELLVKFASCFEKDLYEKLHYNPNLTVGGAFKTIFNFDVVLNRTGALDLINAWFRRYNPGRKVEETEGYMQLDTVVHGKQRDDLALALLRGKINSDVQGLGLNGASAVELGLDFPPDRLQNKIIAGNFKGLEEVRDGFIALNSIIKTLNGNTTPTNLPKNKVELEGLITRYKGHSSRDYNFVNAVEKDLPLQQDATTLSVADSISEALSAQYLLNDLGATLATLTSDAALDAFKPNIIRPKVFKKIFGIDLSLIRDPDDKSTLDTLIDKYIATNGKTFANLSEIVNFAITAYNANGYAQRSILAVLGKEVFKVSDQPGVSGSAVNGNNNTNVSRIKSLRTKNWTLLIPLAGTALGGLIAASNVPNIVGARGFVINTTGMHPSFIQELKSHSEAIESAVPNEVAIQASDGVGLSEFLTNFQKNLDIKAESGVVYTNSLNNQNTTDRNPNGTPIKIEVNNEGANTERGVKLLVAISALIATVITFKRT